MKKLFFILVFVAFTTSCTKSSVADDAYDETTQSVDGEKIKRPGSGG